MWIKLELHVNSQEIVERHTTQKLLKVQPWCQVWANQKVTHKHEFGHDIEGVTHKNSENHVLSSWMAVTSCHSHQLSSAPDSGCR
jgi:hypothetical protein